METQGTLNSSFFSSLESCVQHLKISLYDDGGVMVTQKSCMVGTFLNASPWIDSSFNGRFAL